MLSLSKILFIVQFAVSIFLIVAILLQQRGAGTSAIMGGGGASYYSKRGFDKVLFITTIVLSTIFVVISILAIVIH